MTMTARQLNNEDDDSIVDAESASMSKSCLMLKAPPCFVKYSSDQPYWETIDNPGDEDYQVKYDQKARNMTARQLNKEDDDSIVDDESASMSCKI